MKDFFSRRSIFPNQLAGLLIQRNETRRLWGRDIDMPLIHAISSNDENQIANNQRRAGCKIVRKNIELFHHVVLPDEVGIDIALVRFFAKRSIILFVQKSLGIS